MTTLPEGLEFEYCDQVGARRAQVLRSDGLWIDVICSGPDEDPSFEIYLERDRDQSHSNGCVRRWYLDDLMMAQCIVYDLLKGNTPDSGDPDHDTD